VGEGRRIGKQQTFDIGRYQRNSCFKMLLSRFVSADAAIIENFLAFGRDSVFRGRAIGCRCDLLDQAIGPQTIEFPVLLGFKFCPERRATSTIAGMPSSPGVRSIMVALACLRFSGNVARAGSFPAHRAGPECPAPGQRAFDHQ
jgi:hypothetical protein